MRMEMKAAREENSGWREYFENNDYNIFNQTIRLKKPIEVIVKYARKNGRILEVGCGSGFSSILLSKLGYDVTATDLDHDVLKYVLERKRDMNSSVKILRMDTLNICFKDKKFDVVFHQGLLEHFDDGSIEAALKEQERVAELVIFDVPNSRYKLGPGNKGDERLLSINYWEKLIRKAGLNIVGIYGRGLTRKAYFLPYGLVRLFEYLFTTSTIFVCRKPDV